jgi:hypothetical protein
MSKARAIAHEIFKLNLKQAYEIAICKCECWERKPHVKEGI